VPILVGNLGEGPHILHFFTSPWKSRQKNTNDSETHLESVRLILREQTTDNDSSPRLSMWRRRLIFGQFAVSKVAELD
jgi:hypothetical protein